jgi:outer membrane protein OmpA-like peptidoglycan-associated protein
MFHAFQSSPRRSLRSFSLVAVAASLSLAQVGLHAQASPEAPVVLKGKSVTEDNLVDALAPADTVVTRSLRVQRDGASGQQAVRKPSASLLITFETASATLTPAARKQLDVVAAALRNDKLSEYNFNVEGHADPRGAHDTNLTLSQQRAESVRSYLVTVHNIDPKRLKALGKGDSEQLNKDNPAAEENRRVTIVTDVQSN